MVMKEHNYSSSYSWWFHSHSNDRIPRRSTWLSATLAELEETTMAMLNIIEEDADSFAKLAEMYYKKRPELIGVIKHMYESHRSLAEQFDRLKSEEMISSDKSYDVYSLESAESVVDDPYDHQDQDLDQEEEVHLYAGKEQEEDDERITELREEIEGVKEEKKRMEEELNEKNEEKREVIRQLTMALDMVTEENVLLRRKLAPLPKERFINRPSSGGRTVLMELKRLKDTFLEKLFNGSRTRMLKLYQ